MQTMLPDDELAIRPSATTVTWREPVEVSSRASGSVTGPGSVTGSEHGNISGNFGQGSRPLSGSGSGSPITASPLSDSRSLQDDGIPESVLIVPMEDGATSAELQMGLLGAKKVIRARSRPRRSDEPAPFLSVDTLPVDKVVVEGKSPTFKSSRPSSGRRFTGSPKKYKDPAGLNNSMNSSVSGGGVGRRTPQSSQGYGSGGQKQSSRPNSRASSSNSHMNYNSFFTHKNSAFLTSGPPTLWSAGNKFWPHSSTPVEKRRMAAGLPPVMAMEATSVKPNQLVTQPFKHDVDAPPVMDRPVSPSQEMKERTLYAVREVSRDLAKKNPPSQPNRNGRLLKGKLKPLHTFKVQGPSIEECKGVQAEDRPTYTPSQARMLQRKRELLNMLPPDVYQQRPLTQESFNHSSAASNLSDDRVQDLESALRSSEDPSMMYTANGMPMSAVPVQMSAFTRMPPNSLASFGSVSDMAEPDGTISPSIKDEPEGVNADNLTDNVNGSLENGDSTSSNKPTTGNVVPSAPPEATMSDYLNEGGAASILSDMVDRVKHSTQRVSEEAVEAVEGAFNESMMVDPDFSEPPSRQSETPRSRSVVSDGDFDSASQRSVRFSLNGDDDTEANGSITNEDGFQDDVSFSSSRMTGIEGQETVAPVGHVQTNGDGESVNQDQSQQHTNGDVAIPSNSQDEVTVDTPPCTNGVATNPRDVSSDVEITVAAVDSGGGDISSEKSNVTAKFPEEQSDNVESKTGQLPSNVIDASNLMHNSNVGNTSELNVEPLSRSSHTTDQAEVLGDNTTGKPEPSDQQTSINQDSESIPPVTRELQQLVTESGKDDGDGNNNISITTLEQNKTDDQNQIENVMEDKDQMVQEQYLVEESKDVPSACAIMKDSQVVSDDLNEEQNKTLSSPEPNVDKVDGLEVETVLVSEANNDESDPSKTDDDEDDDERESCNNNDDASTRTDEDKDDPDGSCGDGRGSGGAGGSGHGGNSGGGWDCGKSNQDDHEDKGHGDSQHGNNGSGGTDNVEEPKDNLAEFEKFGQYTTEQNAMQRSNTCKDSTNHPPPLIRKRTHQCWYGELEDDVPEIEDSVLFCGLCGLDEDSCLCPHSTLALTRTQSGRSQPTYKKQGTNETLSKAANQNRLLSAPGAMQRTVSDIGNIANVDLSSDANTILLEYKALLGHDASTGCYSSELSSSPRKQPQQADPDKYFMLKGVSVADVRQDSHTDTDSGCESEILLDSGRQGRDDGVISNSSEDLSERADPSTLEVVAKPKTLSRPRSAKKTAAPQPAPFPPLCFRINVRPPPGKLFYFAYGADMNPKRMATYLGSTVERRWGVLFGFKLKFNKRGSDLEAGGFPNIEFDPESSVEGCIYVITQAQLKTLDMFIGSPEFYIHAMFPTWMSNCFQPEEFGVAQYCVPALTYIAQDKWTHTDTTQPLPCRYNVDQCLKGSDLLTTDYIQHMKALVVA